MVLCMLAQIGVNLHGWHNERMNTTRFDILKVRLFPYDVASSGVVARFFACKAA